MGSSKQMAQAYAKAWCSGDPAAVASFYAPDGQISINGGDALKGTQAVTDMAAGFYSEFPDLVLTCDFVRAAGSHVVFMWTLEGHHSGTKNAVKASGWEEWDINGDGKVQKSLGWFDAQDYQRQIDGV